MILSEIYFVANLIAGAAVLISAWIAPLDHEVGHYSYELETIVKARSHEVDEIVDGKPFYSVDCVL